MIQRILDRYDNEDRELVLRWRLWRFRWFPYRTAELLGWKHDTSGNREMLLGPWKWHRPDRFTKTVLPDSEPKA